MMFDEANTSRDGVFPFVWPTGFNSNFGPVGSDLSALYIGAIFYDVANEAGLGLPKADLLIWKTISLISNNVTFPMRGRGAGRARGRGRLPAPSRRTRASGNSRCR